MMSETGDGKRRYRCGTCGYRDKWIPGRDSDLERTLRTGCPHCERITTFKKAGIR